MQEVGADVHITGSHLTNETEFTVVLSGICISALTGVPPAADTGYRLAQPVTPETVCSPTLAGRRSKPRNLIYTVEFVDESANCGMFSWVIS